MKNSIKITLSMIPLILLTPYPCLAQPKSPVEVVEFFNKEYGGPLMDELAEYTTPKFGDNKPKSVWVVDTWRILRKMKYERLSGSIIDSKVKDDKAVVVAGGKIGTVVGDVTQKEVFYLIKSKETWLIDELIVTDEEIDLEKMEL
jgi:hypothetical protein